MTFPKINCKYKILPKISDSTQFGTGGTAALTTILKLGEMLSEDEFQTFVIPGVYYRGVYSTKGRDKDFAVVIDITYLLVQKKISCRYKWRYTLKKI